jgi:hypothetical protein
MACSSTAAPRPLDQDAYVWQRNWTPAVHAAVATAPAALGGLRVLVAEAADPQLAMVAADPVEAHRPLTLVVRIDGARPIAELSLAPVLAVADRWRAAGIAVAGIEIDHDCATARLPDYATWLRAHRPAGLRYSITALPTWAGSPALHDVAAAVDELVVQVHAVRAPAIFEPAARADLARFAAAVPEASLRVALPTYRAQVYGTPVEVEPAVVRAFVDELEREPIANVHGIVWFRLPVAGDDTTWSTDTFAALIERRAPPASLVEVTLRARGDDRFDIVATNPTARSAELPAVRLAGDLEAVELVGGYSERARFHYRPPHRRLAPGETQAIGWVRGKAPHVALE